MATISFSLDDFTALDPNDLLKQCVDNGIDSSRWDHLANSFVYPTGFAPGRGWLLMSRTNFEKMKIPGTDEKRFTLTIASEVTTIQIKNVSIISSTECMMPGGTDDINTAYLLEIADHRWHYYARGKIIIRGYNVRSPADGSYYPGTLNNGVPYTWQEISDDLWPTELAKPLLPFTPQGTPENFWYHGVSKFRALEHFFVRLACTVAYNSDDDTFKTFQLGDTTDVDLIESILSAQQPVYDSYAVVPNQAAYPSKVTVEFVVKPVYDDGSVPYYSVDEAGTNVPPASTGTFDGSASDSFVILQDDLTAQSDGANVTNSTDLDNRAKERRDDWERKREFFDTDIIRVYAGLYNFTTSLGALYESILWDARAGVGLRTEIRSGSVMRDTLASWRRCPPNYDGMEPFEDPCCPPFPALNDCRCDCHCGGGGGGGGGGGAGQCSCPDPAPDYNNPLGFAFHIDNWYVVGTPNTDLTYHVRIYWCGPNWAPSPPNIQGVFNLQQLSNCEWLGQYGSIIIGNAGPVPLPPGATGGGGGIGGIGGGGGIAPGPVPGGGGISPGPVPSPVSPPIYPSPPVYWPPPTGGPPPLQTPPIPIPPGGPTPFPKPWPGGYPTGVTPLYVNYLPGPIGEPLGGFTIDYLMTGGTSAVTSFNTRTGAVTLTTTDVLSTNLGYQSLAALTADQNNYAPTPAEFYSITTDGLGSKNITGLSIGQVEGQIVYFYNAGATDAINFKLNSASSSAANTFHNGASLSDVVLGVDGKVCFRYTNTKWEKLF